MFNRLLLKIAILLLSVVFCYFIIKSPEYTTLIALPVVLTILVCFCFLDLLSPVKERFRLMEDNNKNREILIMKFIEPIKINGDKNDER